MIVPPPPRGRLKTCLNQLQLNDLIVLPYPEIKLRKNHCNISQSNTPVSKWLPFHIHSLGWLEPQQFPWAMLTAQLCSLALLPYFLKKHLHNFWKWPSVNVSTTEKIIRHRNTQLGTDFLPLPKDNESIAPWSPWISFRLASYWLWKERGGGLLKGFKYLSVLSLVEEPLQSPSSHHVFCCPEWKQWDLIHQ